MNMKNGYVSSETKHLENEQKCFYMVLGMPGKDSHHIQTKSDDYSDKRKNVKG